MGFQLFIMGIHLSAFRIFYAQGLNRCYDNAALISKVLWPQLRKIRDIKYPYTPVKCVVQRFTVGMTVVLQCLNGLTCRIVFDGTSQRTNG